MLYYIYFANIKIKLKEYPIEISNQVFKIMFSDSAVIPPSSTSSFLPISNTFSPRLCVLFQMLNKICSPYLMRGSFFPLSHIFSNAENLIDLPS